jgi:hypothetical protein
MYAPYTLAFMNEMSQNITILDTVINCIFLVDIFINLISAYQDEEYNVVTDHKVI